MTIDLQGTARFDPGLRDVARQVQHLRDTQEVVDALYRFGAGQDLRDTELFLSAFSPDAVLDFTQPASRFGATVPVMHGREMIAGDEQDRRAPATGDRPAAQRIGEVSTGGDERHRRAGVEEGGRDQGGGLVSVRAGHALRVVGGIPVELPEHSPELRLLVKGAGRASEVPHRTRLGFDRGGPVVHEPDRRAESAEALRADRGRPYVPLR